MLAQVPTEIITDPRRYLTMLYGVRGIGKTSFGAQIPGHYFLYPEAGIEGVRVYGDPIFKWEDFIEKCNEIVTLKKAGWKDVDGNPQREITTIIIDTYENLYFLAAKWGCEYWTFPSKGVLHKYKRIEDVPYGKGYTRTNELVIEKLNKLILFGFGILVISHTKERNVVWKGQDCTAYGPKLPPSAAAGICDAAGAVGFCHIEMSTEKNEVGTIIQKEEGRFIDWQSTFLVTAKHRLADFPARLPLPRGEGYQVYLNAFMETVERIKNEKSINTNDTGETD